MFQKVHEEDECNNCVVYLVKDASLDQFYSFSLTTFKKPFFDPLSLRFEQNCSKDGIALMISPDAFTYLLTAAAAAFPDVSLPDRTFDMSS